MLILYNYRAPFTVVKISFKIPAHTLLRKVAVEPPWGGQYYARSPLCLTENDQVL